MTEIKICGITKQEEIEYLKEAGVSYAGFVLYPKSKRYVTIEQAKALVKKLNRDIKSVAVTVSPDEKLVEEILEAGFERIQIHGGIEETAAKRIQIPVWRAVNLLGSETLGCIPKQKYSFWEEGILLDAKEYGSGRTFDWNTFLKKDRAAFEEVRKKLTTEGKKLILAGGLNAKNVAEGIYIFSPDIVDVSSGVEGSTGKEREKILEFTKKVRLAEERASRI